MSPDALGYLFRAQPSELADAIEQMGDRGDVAHFGEMLSLDVGRVEARQGLVAAALHHRDGFDEGWRGR
jgi:hypothetical protein